MDRFILFALAATAEAIAQAAWAPSDAHSRERTATVIASGIGGFPAIVEAVRTTDQRGVKRLSPFTVPSFLANLAAGHISIRHGFKGPEIYVSRSSGAVGPEMGPNMMWDSQYGMGSTCSSSLTQDQARALITTPGGLSVGDGEPHLAYWEFELKRGAAVVNQINVSECAGHTVVNEQAWQPDMQGTYAPHG